MRRPVAALGILAALTSAATEAEAQTQGHSGSARNEPFLLVADEVQYDEDLGLTIAKGHVEISQDKQVILADVVTYNKKTDTLTASGHVSLLDPGGDVVFANAAECRRFCGAGVRLHPTHPAPHNLDELRPWYTEAGALPQ